MASNKYLVLTLMTAGCAAAVLAIGRYTSRLERRQLKEELRDWEDEGGHLAPSESLVNACSARDYS